MAALTLSGPVGYMGGSSQTSGPLVGYMDSKNYVLRYSFKTPSSGYITKLKFSTTLRHYGGSATTTFTIRAKVTTSSTSHKNAGSTTTDYDGSFTFSGAGEYDKSCTISGLWLEPNKTYYLYLFPGGTDAFLKFFYDNSGADMSSLESTAITATYTLTTSAGTGSSITVSRTSSPSGSTGTLSSGATIYAGDVLKITFKASTGYSIKTHTVNGTSFTSGGSHTVSAAVTVNATATVKSFTLSIDAGTGSTITVNRTSSPKGGASTGTLSNGATIYYSDVLKVTFAASTGYNLGTHTVNSSTFTSGNSHTVTAAVTVKATATVKSFSLSISAGTGSAITVNRTSSPKGGAATGDLSDGDTIYYSDVLKITFARGTGYNIETRTVNGTTFTSGNSHTVTAAVAVVSTASVKSYTLSISAGTGSTITVNRTSSPKQGADTGTLSNGATIYYSDVLKITFSAKTGYNLSTTTVNSSDFTSGSTKTVTAAVSVASTATVKSFTLTISAATGSSITVNRTSSPKKGASTGKLSNGATVYHSDVLTITTAASAGYEITTQTVNDSAFTSGGTHTVTANVTIVTLTNTLGLVFIDNGTTLEAYLVYIDNGSSWDQYIPYVDNGSGWDMCS